MLSTGTLKPYQPLLEEINKAIDTRSYRICVPALFSIIEGVAYHNWARNFYRREGRKEFFERKLKGLQAESLGYYLRCSIRTFVDVIFDTATSKKPLVVNRHWILHGRDIPQGTQTDCLRLLLAVGIFAELA